MTIDEFKAAFEERFKDNCDGEPEYRLDKNGEPECTANLFYDIDDELCSKEDSEYSDVAIVFFRNNTWNFA